MSTKTVAEKLLIKQKTTLWLSDIGRLELVEPLPAEVRIVDGPEQAATALVFAADAASVRVILDAHRDQLTHPNHLWVAYPKANRAATRSGRSWPSTACGPSPRWPSTRSGRRCASGRSNQAKHSSPVAAHTSRPADSALPGVVPGSTGNQR
jgi:hypothetical protein